MGERRVEGAGILGSILRLLISISVCCNFLPGSLACFLLFLFPSGSPTDFTIYQQQMYVASNST